MEKDKRLDYVNDFLHHLKKLVNERQNDVIKDIIDKLKTSDLVIAKMILDSLNGNSVNQSVIYSEVEEIEFANYWDNVNKIDINCFDCLESAVTKLKKIAGHYNQENINRKALAYLENKEYDNYVYLKKLSTIFPDDDLKSDVNEQFLWLTNNSIKTNYHPNKKALEQLDIIKWQKFITIFNFNQ
ncbi:MAG: hypothetical protein RSB72_01945 [Bacilli bacterium]